MNDFELLKEQIRERVSMVDIFTRYGVELTRNHTCCCPWHEEKTPSCHVHEEYAHCFGCGKSSDVFAFVMEREGLDFVGAIRMLAAECNLQTVAETPKQKAERQRSADAVCALTAANGLYLATLAKHLADGGPVAEYVLDRRLQDPELRERWGIGFAPDMKPDGLLRALEMMEEGPETHGGQGRAPMKDAPTRTALPSFDGLRAGGLVGKNDRFEYCRFRQRLTFALHDARGRVVGFSGRLIPALEVDSKAKYVNSPESDVFTKGRMIYGLWQARDEIRKTGEVLVVEGQIDVIACHQAGHANAVAPLGTALTIEQAQLLARYAKRVTLCYDGDDAGQAATEKALEHLLPIMDQVNVVLMPEGADVDDMLTGKQQTETE